MILCTIILSPKDIILETYKGGDLFMDFTNDYETCPTCGRQAHNELDNEAILEIGECLSCDEVRADMIQEQKALSEDEAMQLGAYVW